MIPEGFRATAHSPMGKCSYLAPPEEPLSGVPTVAWESSPGLSNAHRVWGKRAGMRLHPFSACSGSSEHPKCAEEAHLLAPARGGLVWR